MNLGKQIELILTEGKHAGSHKFAFLRAIFDYVVEKDPDVGSDLKIPLIFFAEKFLVYYWKMSLYKTQQLTVSGPLRYYEYLKTILKELDLKGVQEGLLEERHIHVFMSELKSRRSLSPRTLSCINEARLITFRHPIVHSKYISGSKGKVYLDFYKYPETGASGIDAKDYSDFYTQERTFITVRRKYLLDLKTMHYWFDKAVLLAWAAFTDTLPSNRGSDMPSGVSLLQMPEPDRRSLLSFRKHFRDIGVRKCAYCSERKFEAVDHVVPWSMVKADRFWNFLPICNSCYSAKSNRIWNLGGEGKRILKMSIGAIVDDIEDSPVYLSQLKDHFMIIGEKLDLENKRGLKNRLYEETLSKIQSFGLR